MAVTGFEWISEVVQRDLAAFADPGTTVSLNPTRDWLQANWIQRGRISTANFKESPKDPSGIRVRNHAGDQLGYGQFLASDRMADLKSIAHNTVRAIQSVQGYVTPRAVVGEGGSGGNAEEGLERAAARPDPRTKLIFVTADAGVGKTSLLTELVHERATKYALARSDVLWLYVNAQGSRLAKLDQALAAALDDVRAPFPYHAVAALVRSEALVLVIDGFDELIGAPGTYDDAYSSLASFLASLEGQGTLVATARSAYYEQEFLTRVGTIPGLNDDAWSLTRIELLEWNDSERTAFLSGYARRARDHELSPDAFPQAVLDVFEESHVAELAAKPFFLSRVAEFTSEGRGLEAGPTFLDRLVNTFLARESQEKLLRISGGPVLSAADFSTFYEEIANEMWREETRELSGASFRELVDVVAQLLGLDDSSRRVVVDRLPNSAFVHPGSAPGSVTFQHELFFSYFLARPILNAIRSLDDFTIATALRKGKLPNQAGEIAGASLVGESVDALVALSLAHAAVSMGGDQIRRNAGSIVAGMLRAGLLPGSIVRDVDLVDVNLARTACERVTFQNCTMRGVDLRDAHFSDCNGTDLIFEAVLVNAGTKLDIRGPLPAQFHGIVEFGHAGRATAVYAPAEIQRVLTAAQLPASAAQIDMRSVDGHFQDLVARFARIFEHTNIASLDDDASMRRIVREPSWPRVYQALLDAGVVREELRQAGGNKSFVRMTIRPRDLFAGLDPSTEPDSRVTRFWELART
jgi:hypothetical protein